MGLLAIGQSQAADLGIESWGTNVRFVDQGGSALQTSDGWLVSIWWKQNETDAYTAIGLTGFLDDYASGWYNPPPMGSPGEFDGMIQFNSTDTLPSVGSAEYFLSIRVFQVDATTLSGLNFGYGGEVSVPLWSDTAAQKAISDLWDDFGRAENQWENVSTLTALPSGAMGGDIMAAMGWAPGTDVVVAIPEPSTWLLLGAGAAFVVIMRRKKKA